MSLQVFGSGKAGEIILHDERPDGTAILLVCREFGAPAATGAQPKAAQSTPSDEVGVGLASSRDGGIFPMLDEGGVAKRKFKLHLDTTAMPGGLMRFAMERFTRRALQAADDGDREVQLTTENAGDWGWEAPVAADASPAASTSGPRDEGVGTVPAQAGSTGHGRSSTVTRSRSK
jgi:hypothetical protein